MEKGINMEGFDKDEQLKDSPILEDTRSNEKKWWFIGAFCILIVILLIQWGAKFILTHVSNKAKKASQHTSIQTDREVNELPIPRSEIKEEQPNKVLNVKEYIAAHRNRDEPEMDSIQKAKLLARIKEKQFQRQQASEMIKSAVLLDIGVSGQKTIANSNKPASGNGYENSNSAYLNQVSNHQVEELQAIPLEDLRFRLLQGTVINGVADPAIDSDLPGTIRGHVTQDVYSADGSLPLVRNGDQLIGEYRSGAIKPGQVRLFVVWTRIISNGASVNLNSIGSDPLGRSGMTGDVNTHFFERYGSAVLTSLISAGASTIGVDTDDQYNSRASYRQSVSNSFSQMARDELRQNATIQNTIEIPQGTPISIMINKDISFEQVLSHGGIWS